jgi:hypothetical protein
LFDDLGAPPGRGPDWLVTLWVVEFNGIDLVMIAATGPSDPTEMVALRRLVESVQIEAPNPVPFPVEIWRPLAVGEQAITEVAPLRLTITLPAGWEGGSWGSRGWSAAQDGFGGLGFAVNVSVPCLEPPSLDGLHTTIDGLAAEHTAVRIGSRQCHPNGVLDKLGYGPGRMQWVDVWVVDVDGIRLWMVATTGSGNATQDAAAMADLGRLVESVDIEAP